MRVLSVVPLLPLSLLLLWAGGGAGTSAPGTDKPFRIYVYDWPASVIDAWPTARNCTHHHLSLQPGFKENAGTGPIVAAGRGMHRTHQYSLFMTFLARLKESPYLTHDPELATHFFLPYDIGMDATTRASDGALTRTGCPRMGQALELLRTSPYFQRNGGRDHFTLHSISQPMIYFVDSHCQQWYEACSDCLKLSIDTFPPEMFRGIQHRPAMFRRWVSIPIPSNYHLSADVAVPPWEVRVDTPRRYALAFSGSRAVTAKKSRQLRDALIGACLRRPRDCDLHVMRDHSSNAGTTPADSDPRASTLPLGPYYDASLCLMPGGDFPTRKAVLDALLTGCVPVVFQRATALTQWTLHWGGLDVATAVSVYMPMETFVEDPDTQFSALVALARNDTFMTEKRRRIARLGSRMQYRLPGSIDGSSNGSGAPGSSGSLPDAVDVVVDALKAGLW